ncbi:hypothetical protein [Pseudomonas sp. CFBP 13727]|uniref:hypothetical protein n=1 Tax=Pseudomonas sp. CFBP 13727 TaxID=2775295 RepID=UPI001FD046E7|nr:hypothetical protein [Pseudomonas sp. CFBP 13727]
MSTLLRTTLASLAVLAVSACASTSPTILKNGQQGLNIDCSGQAMSWDKCDEQARLECPAGYQTVATQGVPRRTGEVGLTDADLGNYQTRSLVVVCK